MRITVTLRRNIELQSDDANPPRLSLSAPKLIYILLNIGSVVFPVFGSFFSYSFFLIRFLTEKDSFVYTHRVMMQALDDYADQISEILKNWNSGDRDALNRLVPIVYDELKKRARTHLMKERAGHTLQTSAIVHETYLKLAGQRQVNWENRGHFLWVASEIMRRVLVDHARAKKRQKRGGDVKMLTLDSALRLAAENSEIDLLELNDALERLAEKDIQQAKIVELRFFGGCSVEETAATLGIATVTVKRDWACAKSWLHRQLSTGGE